VVLMKERRIFAALLVLGLATWVVPWHVDHDLIALGVFAVWGLCFVGSRWIEEERRFRAERRGSAAD
jgi:hypothetical protein